MHCVPTSTGCCRWTRATRCLTRIVLYTEVVAQCDKLHGQLVGWASIVASIVNLVRPTTVESLSHWASVSVELSWQHAKSGWISSLSARRKSSHISPILRSAQCLKISERIEYKLLSLTYKVLTTTQPSYLHNPTVHPPCSPSLIILAHQLHHLLYEQIVPSSMLPLVSGINSQLFFVNIILVSQILTHFFPLFHSRLETFVFCKSFPP